MAPVQEGLSSRRHAQCTLLRLELIQSYCVCYRDLRNFFRNHGPQFRWDLSYSAKLFVVPDTTCAAVIPTVAIHRIPHNTCFVALQSAIGRCVIQSK